MNTRISEKISTARRGFVRQSAVMSIAAPILISAGCAREGQLDRALMFQTLEQGLAEAERLAGISDLKSAAGFSLAQTLVHCAQSIEYSVAGFPKPKSAVFQNTVGSLAFTVFQWRGRMSHDLIEPIPGAPDLDTSTTVAQALSRLRQAVARFDQETGSLKPHFAYGSLSKKEYALANAMHLANHFSVIDA